MGLSSWNIGIGQEIANGRNSAGLSWSNWARCPRRLENDAGFFTGQSIVLMNVNNIHASSSTNTSPSLAQEDSELAARDLRRKTDDLPHDGETTVSSRQWTDEVESGTIGRGGGRGVRSADRC